MTDYTEFGRRMEIAGDARFGGDGWRTGGGISWDATGPLEGRDDFDGEPAGFRYLATGDPGMLYERVGESGWSSGIPIGGTGAVDLATSGDSIAAALQQGQTPPGEDGSLATWEADGKRMGWVPMVALERAPVLSTTVTRYEVVTESEWEAILLDPPEDFATTRYDVVADP